MPTVVCVHHLERPDLGAAEAPLRAAGLDLDERTVAAEADLPALDAVDGILSFGGTQSARDARTDPALGAEVAWLREAVAAGVPVLGVCLGAQLLACSLGARVSRSPRRTIAWRWLEPLPAATGDALVGELPTPVPALHWNEDVFDLPPGATELFARAGDGVEGFRAGERAWGVQFHPDVSAESLARWYSSYGDWLAEAGVSLHEARAADARHLPEQEVLADRLFGAFARVVDEYTAGRG
jgi:GMP synthase (glutamine-hydrolysing)